MTHRPEKVSAALADRELDLLLVSHLVNVRWLTGFTGSSAAAVSGLRVAPKAANVAFFRCSSVLARSKNSVSLGTAPGHPPSMKPTPSSSRYCAITILSATDSASPSCCAPSRRVVS